jgi:hypothetical protein
MVRRSPSLIEYNEGLKKRYDITVYFEDESVFDKPDPTGEGGRPPGYSDGYIELGLTLKAVYRQPYRGLEGFLRGILKLNGLEDKPVPEFTTFCTRAKTLDLELRLEALQGQKISLLVDSIGAEAIRECERLCREEWKKKRGYYRRSLAETAMYRYKTSFGEKMFSREFDRQKTEARVKVKTINLFRNFAAPSYDYRRRCLNLNTCGRM